MVGCCSKTFKKTYVINQKPLLKPVSTNGKPQQVPGPSQTQTPGPSQTKTPGPRYSRFLDELNPSTANGYANIPSNESLHTSVPSSPIIKVIEVRDDDKVPRLKRLKPAVSKDDKVKDENKEREQQDTKGIDNLKGPEGSQNSKSKEIGTSSVRKPELTHKTENPPNGTLPSQAKFRTTTQRRPLPEVPTQEIHTKLPQGPIQSPEIRTEPSKEIRRELSQVPIQSSDNTIKKQQETLSSKTDEKPKKQRAPTIGQSSEKQITNFSDSIKEEEESIYNDFTLQESDLQPKPEDQTINKKVSAELNNETSSKHMKDTPAESENADEEESIYGGSVSDRTSLKTGDRPSKSTIISSDGLYDTLGRRLRRSRIQPVRYEPKDNVQLPVNLKSESDENLIRRAIEKNELLSKVINKKVLMDQIIDAMYDKDVHAKEIIIKQGEKGAHMYISAKGRYQALNKGKPVGEFSDIRVFGELAILYNAPRNATIKALTAGKVWVLDQKYYHQITVGHYIQNQDEIMDFLKKNEQLGVAGHAVLQVVANLLKTEVFPGGKQIVKQGDPGHQFFIIRAGTVTITKEGEGVVGIYKKGDCFGELALLKEDKRQATVTADPPGVECLTLTREQFIQHFGEVETFKDAKRYDKRDSVQVARTEYGDIDIKKLRIVTTLGVGGFGRVELVQHEDDKNMVFALKYLKKYDVVSQHQQEHVINERAIQMACRSLFIVRMYRTFRDNKFVFFLMEPCLGGDVWGLLQKQKNRRFDEPDARFISASVIEAFDYLHARGIIYRDLKPENLLIAENGYIKLTDFGFAKKMTERGKTFTFAGTPEYVAPEIVLNRGHDRAVDYWTLGIFVYEMLRGKTPFRTDDSSHMKTYTKILGGIDNADFANVPHKARHLIEKLCRPIPSDRLGMQKIGIKEIKNHRWFLGFEWEKFGKCEMHSPFKPKLKSPIDTSYIDKFKKDGDVPPDEISGWDDGFN